MSQIPTLDSLAELPPDERAILALEGEIAESHSVARHLLDYAAPTAICMACFVWSYGYYIYARLGALMVLVFATSFIIERRADRRLALVLAVLRELRKQSKLVEERGIL